MTCVHVIVSKSDMPQEEEYVARFVSILKRPRDSLMYFVTLMRGLYTFQLACRSCTPPVVCRVYVCVRESRCVAYVCVCVCVYGYVCVCVCGKEKVCGATSLYFETPERFVFQRECAA